MNPLRHSIASRAPAVFAAWLSGRGDDLHPADRAEADAFWSWLSDFERPEEQPAPDHEPSRWTASRWMAIAAAVALVAIGIGSWFAIARPSASFERSIIAANGERRVVRLADGSIVTLAAGSRVDIRYERTERRLWLRRGEALFEVAHNRARPFVVQTVHGEVKAVGTAFDVAVGTHDAKVTVVEGVIRIALPVQPGRLAEPIIKFARKGERLEFGVIDDQKGMGSMGFISQSADADLANTLAWTKGQLIFRGEPLHEVIATINRYATSSKRVNLTNRAAANTPVYGVIDQGDTSAIKALIEDPDAVAIGNASFPRQPPSLPASPSLKGHR